MCWPLTTVTKYNEYEAEQTCLLHALSFSDFTIQTVQWPPLWQNFYVFFRNLHCLLGGCKKRGGEGGRGQLPFLFLLITNPFWHLPCRLGFTKWNKIMMDISWLRGQQICPLYYISMLTVSSKEGRRSSWLFWLWREVTTWNMPAFAG